MKKRGGPPGASRPRSRKGLGSKLCKLVPHYECVRETRVWETREDPTEGSPHCPWLYMLSISEMPRETALHGQPKGSYTAMCRIRGSIPVFKVTAHDAV